MDRTALHARLTAMWKQIYADVLSRDSGKALKAAGAKFVSLGEDGFSITFTEDVIPGVTSDKAVLTYFPSTEGFKAGVIGLRSKLVLGSTELKGRASIPLTRNRPGFTTFDGEALAALLTTVAGAGADTTLYESTAMDKYVAALY